MVRRRQAALEQVAWLPCQPGACELGKLAGNTTAARASSLPQGKRASPPRTEGGVPRADAGAPSARILVQHLTDLGPGVRAVTSAAAPSAPAYPTSPPDYNGLQG